MGLREGLPIDVFAKAVDSQIAKPFMPRVKSTSTRLAAAALAWKSGLGLEVQLKIWMGSTVNWSSALRGKKAM